MDTLAPAHPVYAKIEDEYQRDTQAEQYATDHFNAKLGHLRRLPIEKKLLIQIEDEITECLCGLFITGWNAARDEQNR